MTSPTTIEERMNTDDLNKLKRLAEAVCETWIKCDRGDYGDYDGNCNVILDEGFDSRIAVVFDEDDAAFIAAANPQTVLALLGRIEEADKENKRLRKAMDVQKRAAFTLADATQKIADAKVKHYVEKDRSEYYAEQSLDSERGMNAILTEENEALTAQVSQLEEALERQHGDIGILIAIINWLEAATGESPEGEDAVLFSQITADHNEEIARKALGIDAALANTDQRQWGDISTAPKDGTKFLAHWPDHENGDGQREGHFEVTWMNPKGLFTTNAAIMDGYFPEDWQPSLWQPIAAPDTQEGG